MFLYIATTLYLIWFDLINFSVSDIYHMRIKLSRKFRISASYDYIMIATPNKSNSQGLSKFSTANYTHSGLPYILLFSFLPCPVACGILVPWPGNRCSLHWKHRVSTGPPAKCLRCIFDTIFPLRPRRFSKALVVSHQCFIPWYRLFQNHQGYLENLVKTKTLFEWVWSEAKESAFLITWCQCCLYVGSSLNSKAFCTLWLALFSDAPCQFLPSLWVTSEN